jgi:myo-inositol 2-dehydrogenase / D-chiro-inositol 1-dehydrogenase
MVRSRHIPGSIGVAVIGCGTIGRLRAHNVHRHPSVDFLAACDIDATKAETVAREVEADMWGTDAAEVVRRDDIDAVIVATTENAHFEPSLAAIQAGKHVLVEKPFTIEREEGQKLLAAADEYDVLMYTGFTQRFRRKFLGIKEHVDQGYLGEITAATTKIYLTQAVGRAVISRAGTTTPAINTLTYNIDLLLWFLGNTAKPVSVYAQGNRGRIGREFGVNDSTWSLLTFDNGVVAQLATTWELPEFSPAYNCQMEFELFGLDGVIAVKDDHRENLLVSHKKIPSPYTPAASVNAAMLGSNMPGDWAQGEYVGPMRDETQAFLNSVGTGRRDPILATGQDGLKALVIGRAIDRSIASGEVVQLVADDGLYADGLGS